MIIIADAALDGQENIVTKVRYIYFLYINVLLFLFMVNDQIKILFLLTLTNTLFS